MDQVEQAHWNVRTAIPGRKNEMRRALYQTVAKELQRQIGEVVKHSPMALTLR